MQYTITYRVAKPLKTPFDTPEFETKTIEIKDAFDGTFRIECTDALTQPHQILVCPELINVDVGNQTQSINLIVMGQKSREQDRQEGKNLKDSGFIERMRLSNSQPLLCQPPPYPESMRHRYLQITADDVTKHINKLFEPLDKLLGRTPKEHDNG